jgi:putative oxidoreductase
MDVGLLILRVVVGGLFFAHGAQKLFGWFGGYGREGTGGFFAQLGYPNGTAMATVAGLTEAGAGLMLAAGFLVPLAAAGIIGVMINAILTAKRNAGLIGGWEIDLVYLTAALALAFTGAGAYSVDHLLDRSFDWSLGAGFGALASGGWRYGVAALALAVVTSALALGSRRTQPAPAEVQPSEEQKAA